jgi:hypothetical protein
MSDVIKCWKVRCHQQISTSNMPCTALGMLMLQHDVVSFWNNGSCHAAQLQAASAQYQHLNECL